MGTVTSRPNYEPAGEHVHVWTEDQMLRWTGNDRHRKGIETEHGARGVMVQAKRMPAKKDKQ